jgi:hypothetical protein
MACEMLSIRVIYKANGMMPVFFVLALCRLLSHCPRKEETLEEKSNLLFPFWVET